MSKYTTELRYICEMSAGGNPSSYQSINEILDKSVEKIFNFDFPIFDESYRLYLEKKILRYYYTREICEETVGLWKLRLENKMNQIMPYYNYLYRAQMEMLRSENNPFYNVNVYTKKDSKDDTRTESVNSSTENATGSNRNDFTSNNSASGTEKANTKDVRNTNELNYNLYSDTPQGALNGVDSERYLTNATKVKDTITDTDTVNTDTSTANKSNYHSDSLSNSSSDMKRTGNSNGMINSVNDFLEHRYGIEYNKTMAEVLKSISDNLLNIDEMIINDLSTLFFALW